MLQSKYAPPKYEDPTIDRVGLENYLRGKQKKRLTVLSAPAGYGKSRLMNRWYELLVSENSTHCAWLTIDLVDSSGPFEMRGLLEAMASAKPMIDGIDVLANLKDKSDLEICVEVIRFLEKSKIPLVFFLDDYDLLTSATAEQCWSYLMAHLPPDVNFVLGTRTLPQWPLSRMQSEGYCQIIGPDRLRFSVTETSRLARGFQNVDIDENQAYTLNYFVRGWPIALKLVFANLKAGDDRLRVNAAIHGDNPLLVAYAKENVLDSLDEHTRKFIHDTAHLEVLNTELCEFVCETLDADKSIAMLEEASILFPREGRDGWFDYLPILRDYLRKDFSAVDSERLAQLHGRAEAWFRDQGFAKEALTHALGQPDYDKAITLMERNAGDLIVSGSFRVMFDFYSGLPQETIEQNPHLLLPLIWILVITQDFHEAQRQLDKFYKLTENLDQPLKKTNFKYSPDLMKIIEYRIRQAFDLEWQDVSVWQKLKQSIDSSDHTVRCQLEFCLARAFLRNERFAEAFTAFMEARRYAELGNIPITEITSSVRMAEIRQTQGRLDEALELCNFAIRRSRSASGEDVPALGIAYLLRAELYYEHNQLEDSERDLVDATSRFEQFSGYIHGAVQARLLAAKISYRGYGPISALQILDVADREAITTSHHVMLAHVRSEQIRYHVIQGDLSVARALLEQQEVNVESRGPNPNFSVTYRESRLYLALCHYLISADRPADAGRWLIKLLHQPAVDEKRLLRVELTTMQALAYWVADDQPKALRSIREALMLGERCGAINSISDRGPIVHKIIRSYRAELKSAESERSPSFSYIDLLLDENQSAAGVKKLNTRTDVVVATPSSRNTRDLTQREIEILLLICDGLSNRAVAEQLILGEGTIKWHLKNIYLKLHVNSRTQAAATARSMGLVGD